MTYPFASASARPVGRFFATAATAALVTVFAATTVLAQQPAPAPAKPAPRAPAPAKPAPAKPAAPAAQQAPAAPAAPQAGAAPQQQPQLIYSPWTKFCLKGQEKDAKQVCFTGKDARIESGMPVVAAVLIEPDAPDAKKVLRVTVPLGVQLTHGTRVIVDQAQPMQGPFVI
jgi:invasion protein IalB